MITLFDQINSCEENILHQLLKVQAQVKVTPLVKHGTPRVCCIDSKISEWNCCDFDCTYESHNNCNFVLTQVLCIEIPISFDAKVDIKKGILGCNMPDINHDCNYEVEDDISRNSEFGILMNRKVQF